MKIQELAVKQAGDPAKTPTSQAGQDWRRSPLIRPREPVMCKKKSGLGSNGENLAEIYVIEINIVRASVDGAGGHGKSVEEMTSEA